MSICIVCGDPAMESDNDDFVNSMSIDVCAVCFLIGMDTVCPGFKDKFLDDFEKQPGNELRGRCFRYVVEKRVEENWST